MAGEVKRYRDVGEVAFAEDAKGRWVLHADHVAECQRLKQDLQSADEALEAQHKKFDECPHTVEFNGRDGTALCGCSYDTPSDVCAFHAPQLRDALAECQRLREALRASERLRKNEYLPWTHAGGLNECDHGYADGFPCPRCDEATVAALAEPAPAGCQHQWVHYCPYDEQQCDAECRRTNNICKLCKEPKPAPARTEQEGDLEDSEDEVQQMSYVHDTSRNCNDC